MAIKHLFQELNLVYSYEVFPPRMEMPMQKGYDTVWKLSCLNPDYISVTYGAGGSAQNNRTTKLTGYIKNRHGIDALAHLTCIGATKQHIDFVLAELKARSVTDILALRGDIPEGGFDVKDFIHSQDLIRYVKSKGFGVAAAAYPEGHMESRDLDQDVDFLKKKEDAGADYFITQLFFCNDLFYNFIDKVYKKGIRAPIQAGIMPITNKRQVKRILELSGATLPKRLLRLIDRYGHDDSALRDAGIAYATEQIADLIATGVPGIHLYTMNNPDTALSVTRNIQSLIQSVNRSKAI